MYELKTLLPEFEIQLPTTMYAMKNQSLSGNGNSNSLNGGGVAVCNGNFATAKPSNNKTANITTTTSATTATTKKENCALDLDILGAQIQQILKSSNDVGSIIVRQDQVLQQLNDLKAQLADIRSTLGVCQKGPQHNGGGQMSTAHKAGNNGGLREEPLNDIVINGHPNFIPYALLALKNAWQNSFDIVVKTFTHSTMADIGPAAKAFEEQLQKSATAIAPATTANKPKINVSLIWKNCEHTEMISSPTMYVPIYGEVNIIRYLGRIGPAEYRYEDSPLCNEIDLILDICYQLLRCNTPKGIAGIVRVLNEHLGKQQYFGGDSMSVADIGVHSALKRLPKIKDKDLTPGLVAWRKRAELVTRI